MNSMQIVPSEQVQALGNCLYTTCRIHDHIPLFWEAHQQRLSRSMETLGFEPPIHWSELKAFVTEHAPVAGLCRITVTETEVLVSYRGFKPIPEQITVLVSHQLVHPDLALHKTGNHLPYALAAREGQKAQAFEALLWDASGPYVVDGTRAGFFLQKNGDFIEPLGGLPSITRQQAFEELGVSPVQQWVTLEDLQEAEGVWLCGSGMGVLPIDVLQQEGKEQLFKAVPSLNLKQIGLIPPR